jgi:hypothetical protein
VAAGVEFACIAIGGKTRGQIYRKLRHIGLEAAGARLRWRAAEDESLREQIQRTGDIRKVSIAGRNPRAVRARARKLGLRWSRKGAWTAAEVSLLRESFEAGKRGQDIVVPGRTAVAVRNRLKRLGLLATSRRTTRTWSAREIKQLRSLVEEGMTARAITELGVFGDRTQNAIAQQMRRWSMVRRRRKRWA